MIWFQTRQNCFLKIREIKIVRIMILLFCKNLLFNFSWHSSNFGLLEFINFSFFNQRILLRCVQIFLRRTSAPQRIISFALNYRNMSFFYYYTILDENMRFELSIFIPKTDPKQYFLNASLT